VDHNLERQQLDFFSDERFVFVAASVNDDDDVTAGLHFIGGQNGLDVVTGRATCKAREKSVQRVQAVHPHRQEVPVLQACW
jgi:hypothetical protein